MIVDFDGVLLDVKRFRSDFFSLADRWRIPPHVMQETYYERKEKDDVYRMAYHLDILKEKFPHMSVSDIESEFSAFAGCSFSYLYPDAAPFLAHMNMYGIPMVLCTSGSDFQEKKVQGSGLSSFFQKIVVVPHRYKSASIAKIMDYFSGREPFFIDDWKLMIDEVKEKLPDIYAIQLIRSRDEEKSAAANMYASDLEEIKTKVNSWYGEKRF